jgi:P-type Ca2+ transporter type 2C
LRIPNAAFRWVVGGTMALLALVLFAPFAQQLFHFAPLHADDLLFSLGAGLACVLWFEALKQFQRRRHARLARGLEHSAGHSQP